MNLLSQIIDKAKFGITNRIFAGFSNKYGRRGYNAGKLGRFVTDWLNLSENINKDIRESKERVDLRSSDLYKNNPYASAYKIRSRSNVIGHEGFKLQIKSKFPTGEYDEYANNLIETAFEKWCKRQYCTMSGRFSFVRVQWLIQNQLDFYGEFLVRKIINVPLSQNPFGFSLDLMDPQDIDVTYNEELSNGNIVLLGVEIDPWRKIQAIWIKQKQLKDEIGFGSSYYSNRVRIPADEFYYDFDPDHPKQVRGMTPLANVMLSLKGVDRWEDYSLVNAAAAAAKMGFLIRKSLEGPKYLGSSKNGVEEVEPDGGKYMDFEAGIIEELPFGYEFIGYDPKYPHEQHAPFLKSLLRKIAGGLGVSYNSFANDLEGVNFSSMRSGLFDERDNWKNKQTFLREAFLIPVGEDWLKWSLMSGALSPLSPANFDRYNAPYWQPRRWPWIDPLKDVQADVIAVKHGFKTNTQVIADRGGDIEDNYRELAREKTLQEKYGLKLGEVKDQLVTQEVSGNDNPEGN